MNGSKLIKMNDSLTKRELINLENINKCPICSSSDFRQLWDSYDRMYKVSEQKFSYFTCLNCDAVFLKNRPLKSEIYKFYPENYGPYHKEGYHYNSGNVSSGINIKNTFKKVFQKVIYKLNPIFNRTLPDNTSKIINEHYNRKIGGYFLDFGCGSDAFLNYARNIGWKTIGMDFSEHAIEKVESGGHKAILYSSEASWAEIEDDSLSFVRMNHVLEHLYNPLEVLQQLRRKLKTGGVLHIAIPNPAGISASFYKDKWWGLDAPRHIILYSPKALAKTLEECGFSSYNIVHEFLTKDLARSIGFSKYEKGEVGFKEAISALDREDLQTLLNIPCRLAQKLGKADRIHAFITKE